MRPDPWGLGLSYALILICAGIIAVLGWGAVFLCLPMLIALGGIWDETWSQSSDIWS